MAIKLRRFIVLVLLEVIAGFSFRIIKSPDLRIVLCRPDIQDISAAGIRATQDIDPMEPKPQSAFSPNLYQFRVQSRDGNGLHVTLVELWRMLQFFRIWICGLAMFG